MFWGTSYCWQLNCCLNVKNIKKEIPVPNANVDPSDQYLFVVQSRSLWSALFIL